MPSRRPPTRLSPSSRAGRDERDAGAAGVPGRLDEQLCFALYAATNAIQRAYAPLLKPLGITYVQYLALLVLWEDDDRTVGEIGRRLFLDSGTLSPVLRRLERSELVTRARLPGDEREVRVRLTAGGRRLERELVAVRATVGRCTGLAPREFRELRGRLHGLRDRLGTTDPGADSGR